MGRFLGRSVGKRAMPTHFSWFGGLLPDELERARRDLTYEAVDADELACVDGAKAEYWMGVVDGLLAISRDNAVGTRTTLTGMPADTWFGEGTLVKRDAWRYDARALRRTIVAKLPIATFDWLLDRSIPFNRFVFNQVNERLGQFVEGLEYDRSPDIGAKVARSLVLLYRPSRFDRPVDFVDISQLELAALCGISRQTVNRALAELEELRLVRAEYRRILILDAARLRSRYTDSLHGQLVPAPACEVPGSGVRIGSELVRQDGPKTRATH